MAGWMLRIAAALTLLLSLSAFETIESPYEAVPLANKAYDEGDYRLAADLYEAALDYLPESPRLQYDLGNAYFQLVDLEQAQAAYMRALATDDRAFAARVYYNLGNVHYQRSLNAMRTFRDAVGPIREAMASYREALDLEPELADAMYNLELADRLYDALKAQREQPQANPNARNKSTSANRGQYLEDEETETKPEQRSPDPNRNDVNSPGEAGGQAPKGTPSQQVNTEADPGGERRELTPEQAQEMVELVRKKAKAAEGMRQQWREARMRDEAVERPW
jgi:Ca-activated chloride channel family protein